MVAIEANWEDPDDDEACIRWARETFDALQPHFAGEIYISFPGTRGFEVLGSPLNTQICLHCGRLRAARLLHSRSFEVLGLHTLNTPRLLAEQPISRYETGHEAPLNDSPP